MTGEGAMSEEGAGGDARVVLRREGAVSWITLNRPERMNALAAGMREELHEALVRAAQDADTRAIVITGAGRAFCAGADVDAMEEMLAQRDERGFAANVEAGMRVVLAIRSTPKPVIAAVNGTAVGAGASLAIACDLRIASEEAKIGFTFNRIGLHPDWGATYYLPRLVGVGRASELILGARILDAQEAAAIGLWHEVVPAGEFPARVAAWAAEIAAKPPLAVSAAKESLERSMWSGFQTMLDVEAAAQSACFRSQDVREGLLAFRERRTPHFRGE
jgi:2-(1,2-epoxy-1,2-dihydrophenyl)acetyl-CoA isomerase